MSLFFRLLSLLIAIVLTSTFSMAANLIVEIEDDPNNDKYSRAWSLWKFCGCNKATQGDGTIGGLGAVADLWSMGKVFTKMPYDMDYMPLDPFIVHINTTWLYSGEFYTSVIADYLATENTKQGDTTFDEAEVVAAENYVYDVLAKKVQEIHLDYVHIGWDTVDGEGVFSFITDFRGHLPIRIGDELCWNGMHMYNVSTAVMESVVNVMGIGGLALDFHVKKGKNLCKDVTGW